LPKRKQILEKEKSEQMWEALFQNKVVIEDSKIGVDLQGMFSRIKMKRE